VRVCKFEDCTRPSCARGLCNGHWQQLKRGKALAPIDVRYHGGMSDQERLDEKTDKSGECWLWSGGKYPNGYGQFTMGGRKTTAHRAAFVLPGPPGPARGPEIDPSTAGQRTARRTIERARPPAATRGRDFHTRQLKRSRHESEPP